MKGKVKTNSRLTKGIHLKGLMTSSELLVELESGYFLTGRCISLSSAGQNKTYRKLKSNLVAGKNKEGIPLSPTKAATP